MGVLLMGCGGFVLALLIQFVVWRIAVPRRQLFWVGIILLLVGVGGQICFWGPGILTHQTPVGPMVLPDALAMNILYLSLALAYMTTFSAVEVTSPTLLMVRLLEQSGPGGLAPEDLCVQLSDETLVIPRIRDLETDRMARREGDRYVLTIKGIRMARLLHFYRELLGLAKGG